MTAEASTPKVFISYCHEFQAHMDRVLELSNRLRREGIDCSIDQYEESPAEGWQRWMLKQVEESQFVLVVCTEKYDRYFRGNRSDGSGKSTTWEGGILIQELYENQGLNSKFIPVVLTVEDIDFIPTPLRSATNYKLYNRNAYELLYRRLTNQRKTIKPILGEQINLAIRERKQSFPRQIFCNLPHRSYDRFIGREAEIARLLERISPNYRQHMNVVKGIGGVGKTALTVEVAYRCLEAQASEARDRNIPTFEAIIFTSSKATDLTDTQILDRPEKEPTLLDIFRVIAETLKEPIITQLPAEQQQSQVYKILSNLSTLLIVDNMETLENQEKSNILSFLNNVPASTQVVITTREHLGLPSIALDRLTQQESRQLIVAQAEAKDKSITVTTQQRNQIYKRFDGIPIAMIYAVGQRAAGYDFADILKPTTRLPQDLGKFCFEGSVLPLRGTVPHKLLIAMTFFSDSPCKDALIEVAGVAKKTQAINDGLAKLQQLSLIAEKDGRYTILSITREYAQDELTEHVDPDSRELMMERQFNWYLKFTQQYGGSDWKNWRSQYDRIEAEWRNIESILYWYASYQEWDKVLKLWEQIDGYVDLNRYWQKRRHWWSKLEKEIADVGSKVKALSEKAWTAIMMGTNHDDYLEAEAWLNEAWSLRESASATVQADIANHLAILETGRKNYETALEWLDLESEILETCQLSNEQRIRSKAQNLYYRAEISYFQKSGDLARSQFEQVIELCEEVGWQRFHNYAQNNLVDILIGAGELEGAENLLVSGLAFAETMREKRRIALYHSSYACFYHQLAQQSEVELEASEYSLKAREYALKAAIVFDEEQMNGEKRRIEHLIPAVEPSNKTSDSNENSS
jgi:SEFIR domain